MLQACVTHPTSLAGTLGMPCSGICLGFPMASELLSEQSLQLSALIDGSLLHARQHVRGQHDRYLTEVVRDTLSSRSRTSNLSTRLSSSLPRRSRACCKAEEMLPDVSSWRLALTP